MDGSNVLGHSAMSLLGRRLAEALPEGLQLTIYHISTPPTTSSSIFAAPPGQKHERTYCESQFLAVAVRSDETKGDDESGLFSFAMEVLIYTTTNLTILFVSKADSTGYLHRSKTPPGYPSTVKIIATTFLSYLSETRLRPGIRLVISLFARAQDQYLFPGSVENPEKHVLDDRGLIRWWCRALDPVLRTHTTIQETRNTDRTGLESLEARIVTGFLLVPGFDRYETLSLFPPSHKTDPADQKKWINGHPLLQISSTPNAPPRCLVPRFPDDPKSRFLDELDEEISESQASMNEASISSPRRQGQWKSVRSLDQFWEMMAFRQECSAGRAVGFIWILFDPVEQLVLQEETQATGEADCQPSSARLPPLPPKAKRRKRKLTGPIIPRQPRVKKSTSKLSTSPLPTQTPFYSWPIDSRGKIVFSEKEYTRVTDMLLRLDFSTHVLAKGSTKRWVEEASVIAGLCGQQNDWGEVVTGRMVIEAKQTSGGRTNSVTVLNAGLVRKKRPQGNEPESTDSTSNILSDGLLQKRRKVDEMEPLSEPSHLPAVSLLGSNLIRKKPKS